MEEDLSAYRQRSEPVQDIIERMPVKFGAYVSSIVICLVALLFIFGWIIQYPDTVTGQITVSAKFSPIKLVANASGRMLLKLKTKDYVKAGEYIAVIQNAANVIDIQKVKTLLSITPPTSGDYELAFRSFPTNASLGEVNTQYYNFLNALKKLRDYNKANLYQKQEEGFNEQIIQIKKLQDNNNILKSTRLKNMALYKKAADRDSLLYSEKVATEEEYDNSRISYLGSREGFQNTSNDINNASQKLSDVENKLEQLHVQQNDDQSKMSLDLITAYDDLKDAINNWELHYVFKSPIDGVLEYLKFWNNDEYIQSGEQAFTIVPARNEMIGQVSLPSVGAGKVKVGQEVIIKLDNYPFQEYGSVKGKVKSVSMTTNTIEVNQTKIDAYLIEVSLPQELTTNYGSKLDFKYELKGTADIVSNRRSLISRFFDNLKYSSNKN